MMLMIVYYVLMIPEDQLLNVNVKMDISMLIMKLYVILVLFNVKLVLPVLIIVLYVLQVDYKDLNQNALVNMVNGIIQEPVKIALIDVKLVQLMLVHVLHVLI